jgi:hypothetical protein
MIIRSRVPTLRRVEWMSRKIHGRSPWIGDRSKVRITTGAPLVTLRARIGQEVTLALKRKPNEDATTACRATGMWCNVSWKPSGKPTTSSEEPIST